MSDILLNSKAQKPFLLSTLPSNSMGSDGDLAISTISNKGVYLSIKSNRRWYTAGKMEELKRAENTSTQKLTLNTLNVNKQINIANLAHIVANAMKVSSSSISIDFDTNIELNGENVNNNANLNVSGLQTIKSETVLTENLMDNPQLNIKYDDNNYVKIGTVKTGGLQIEPYKIDDIDGKAIGPINLMYDGDNYASLQVSDTGNLTIAATGSDSSVILDSEVSVILKSQRDVVLNSGRDIEINADGGDIEFKDDSADLAALSGSGLTINNISEVGSDTDKFLTSDSGVVKYVTGANLRSYIGAGTSSVANLNDLGDVSYSSGDLTISSLDTLNILNETGFIIDSAREIVLDANNGVTKFYLAGDTDDLCTLTVAANGATTIATEDSDGSAGDLTLDIDGDITLDAAGDEIHLKGDGQTFITFDAPASKSRMFMYEAGGASTDDYFVIDVRANAETTIQTKDTAASAGHLNIEPDGHVEFDGCGVGFDLVTPTAGGDTNVDFQTGNKQFVTFGAGNIDDINCIFPAVSGNFVLLLKQDGTGSRVVTNYKAWDRADDDAASGSATVKFAGGSNPTLTTDANHVDIISIFWDADNQIAYGVATLDFQF